MQPPLIAVDFETFYDSEYSLSKMATWAYVNDSKFNAYLVAIHGKDLHWVGNPKKCDWSVLKGAHVVMHNASFDALVLDRLVEQGIVPRDCMPAKISCTADLAAYLGVKRDLKTAARELLQVTVDKQVRSDMKGKTYEDAVMAGIEDELVQYGGKDAELCYQLAEQYLDQWPEEEQEISRLNRESGVYGVAIDRDKLVIDLRDLRARLQDLEDKLPWMEEVDAKPLSLKLIRAQGRNDGIPVPACLAKDDPAVLKWVQDYGDKYEWVRAIGQYRSLNILMQRVKSIHDNLREDSTMPFQIKYGGSHTLRFSGGGDSGGKFNMQNMPKMEMFGVDLRSLIVPRPGHKFIISDFSQIEARVLLWRVGDQEFINQLHQTGNMYIAYAKKALGRNIEKGTHDYQMAKAAVLLLGYYGGWKKFQSMVAKPPYNMVISDEQAQYTVKEYRESNPRIVNHWREHQTWLRVSVNHRDPTHEVVLPNKRVLRYFEPRAEVDGISALHERGGNRYPLHAGILTNNEIQAIARDILCDAWRAAVRKGLRVLWSVHDELIYEVPDDEVEAAIPVVKQCMLHSSPWADGCPIDASISVVDHYCKD